MKDTAKVIAIQMNIDSEDVGQKNLEVAVDLMDQQCNDADIICLPELFLGLNVICSVPGYETDVLCQIAKKKNSYIAAPMYVRFDGLVYNCSILINRNGVISGIYKKVHLWPWESPVGKISAGDSFPVFKTDFGTIGLCICHDHQFPETYRCMVIQGAEIIICATRMPDPFQIPWLEFSKIRSLENQVYVVSTGASLNRCSTHIVRPTFKEPVLSSCGEGINIVEAELDLAWLRAQRQTSTLYRYPKVVPSKEAEKRLSETLTHCFLKERTPQYYGIMSEIRHKE